jgi:hypothetical protein
LEDDTVEINEVCRLNRPDSACSCNSHYHSIQL